MPSAANTAIRFEPASNLTIGGTGARCYPFATTGGSTGIFNPATQTTVTLDPIFQTKLREYKNKLLDNVTDEIRTLSTLEYFNTFSTTGGSNITIGAGTTSAITSNNGLISAMSSGTVYYGAATTSINPSYLKENIKEVIKNNLLIKINSRGQDNIILKRRLGTSDKEERARNALRDMLTEKDWRRYLTNGFIMVRGASGYWYQIFHSYCERIRVYKDGKRVKDICIHTDRTCPPTDHVINMKILIEMDEAAMWANGNVRDAGYGTSYMAVSGGVEVPEKANLVEKYKQTKFWVTGNNVFSFSDNFALAC
jgi:hypothetical protein